MLLALLVAAASAVATLIASGLSVSPLVELLDAGGTARSSRTARSASAKVLLLALATATLIILVAIALLELIGARSTGFAEVLLLLALVVATLIGIIAVALLELIGASRSARRTKVLLIVLVAVLPTVVAIAPAVSGSNLVRGTSSGRRTVFQDRRRQLRRRRAAVSFGLIFISTLVPIALLALVVYRTLVADDLLDGWRLRTLGLIFVSVAIAILVLAAVAEIIASAVEVVLPLEGVGILLGDRLQRPSRSAPNPWAHRP